jgi:DNA-binding MarR family transcriptional regulator
MRAFTGTITPLVKRLQAAGIITRTRDLDDERRVPVDLTGKGREMGAEVRAVTGKIKSACQLTDEDMSILSHTLDALAGSALD